MRRGHLAPKCILPKSTKCMGCGGYGHLKRVCKKKAAMNAVDEVLRLEEAHEKHEKEHANFRRKYQVFLTIEGKVR